MADQSSIFDGLKTEDYQKQDLNINTTAGKESGIMVYEYKNAKRVDNTVQADLSKLKGRSVVVTGGAILPT